MTKPPRQPGDVVDGEESEHGGSGASGGRERSERPTSQVNLPPLAPVALRMETLLTWVAQRTSRFPRDLKFTVGDRGLEACLDVQAALLEATYRPARDPGKARALQQANRALTRARPPSRLSWLMLLARVFRIDLVCLHCNVPLKVVQVVATPDLDVEPYRPRGPPALRDSPAQQLSPVLSPA